MSERKYVKHSREGVIIIPNDPAVSYASDINDWFLWRHQNLALGGDMPTKKFQELGRAGHKNIKLSNSAPVTLTFLESGRILPWALLAGKDPVTTQEVLAGANPTTGADGDFVEETFDVVGMKKNSAGTMVEGVYVGRVNVTGFDITIPSGDDSVEISFNGTGRVKHWLVNDSKYVIREVHTIIAGDDAAGFFELSDLSPNAASTLNSPSGDYTLRVSVAKENATSDGYDEPKELKEGDDYTCSVTGNVLKLTEAGTNTWDFDASYPDIVSVVYTTSADAGGAYVCSFGSLSDSDAAGEYMVTGKQVETYLVGDVDLATIKAASYGSDLSAIDRIYRVKASGVSGSFDREDIMQQGDTDAYASPKNDFTATMALDKFESDITTLAILTGTTAATVKNIRLEDFLTNLNAVVVIYDDADHTNILQRYIMEDLRVPSQNMDGTVGSVFNAGFSIEADNFYVYDIGAGS